MVGADNSWNKDRPVNTLRIILKILTGKRYHVHSIYTNTVKVMLKNGVFVNICVMLEGYDQSCGA